MLWFGGVIRRAKTPAKVTSSEGWWGLKRLGCPIITPAYPAKVPLTGDCGPPFLTKGCYG